MIFVPSTDVLFTCVENAGRSQMAEAFFQKYAKKLTASSAGTKPGPEINPVAVEAMAEIGIDLTSKTPKIISDKIIADSKIIVNMGCMDAESCPALFVDDVINWNISDPSGKSIDDVRKIRDEIESQIKKLVKKLGNN